MYQKAFSWTCRPTPGTWALGPIIGSPLCGSLGPPRRAPPGRRRIRRPCATSARPECAPRVRVQRMCPNCSECVHYVGPVCVPHAGPLSRNTCFLTPRCTHSFFLSHAARRSRSCASLLPCAQGDACHPWPWDQLSFGTAPSTRPPHTHTIKSRRTQQQAPPAHTTVLATRIKNTTSREQTCSSTSMGGIMFRNERDFRSKDDYG